MRSVSEVEERKMGGGWRSVGFRGAMKWNMGERKKTGVSKKRKMAGIKIGLKEGKNF